MKGAGRARVSTSVDEGQDLAPMPADSLFDAFRGVHFHPSGLYDAADWYDMDYAGYVGEQPFYQWMVGRYVRDGTAYVELGAGTGRLSIPLALEGFRVHGVEPATGMRDALLDRVSGLPESAAEHSVEDAHAHNFLGPGDAPIGLVAFPFNGVLHVRGREALCETFDHIRTRLLEDGWEGARFALDLTAPCWETMAWGRVPWGRVDERIHPTDGRRIFTCDAAVFDPQSRVLRTTFRFVAEGETEGAEIVLEQFMWTFPEILSVAQQTGFEAEHLYGDVDFAPFAEGQPRLLASWLPRRNRAGQVATHRG